MKKPLAIVSLGVLILFDLWAANEALDFISRPNTTFVILGLGILLALAVITAYAFFSAGKIFEFTMGPMPTTEPEEKSQENDPAELILQSIANRILHSESDELMTFRPVYPLDIEDRLSNHFPAPVLIGGTLWPTVEHYFQSRKSDNPVYQRKILAAQTAKDAVAVGRTADLSPSWDSDREGFMLHGLVHKFSQNPECAEELRKYRYEGWEILYCNPQDSYWGFGPDGLGQNVLGKLLMTVPLSETSS